MNELLQGRGLVGVAEDKVLVQNLKGPLEEGWQRKVEAFVAHILDAETHSSPSMPPGR
jgi:hypothetical protein